ncbi:MAG: ArsC family transcriptional regulator [Eubacteriaceae bacterium]|nr:ArsC family transcriptional regulator [Eubacteriaceae bacterium]
MNIQIFGTSKSADTRKAQRFFKERGIRFQFIDMKQKGMSRGEFNSVLKAVGGVEAMLDGDARDADALALVRYIYDKEDKLYENQQVIKLPVVRNGSRATVGYQPDVWKTWQ